MRAVSYPNLVNETALFFIFFAENKNVFIILKILHFADTTQRYGLNRISSIVVILIAIATIAIIYYVVTMTSGITDTTKEFFSAIKQNNYSKAYQYTSKEYRAHTTQEQLELYFKATSMTNYLDASWEEENKGGEHGSIGGIIKASDGGEIPVVLKFIKEDGEWKILSLLKEGEGFNVQNNINSIPNDEELKKLVKMNITRLSEAIKNNDFSNFYDHISILWQSQVTKDKLKSIFKKFIDNKVELSDLQSLEPILIQKPRLIEERTLQVKGIYKSNLRRTSFEMLFIFEKQNWKLIGINISSN